MTFNNFRKNLTEEISKKFKNKHSFAIQAEIDPGNLTHFLDGYHRSIRLDIAVKMAKALDVTVDYLVREPSAEQ